MTGSRYGRSVSLCREALQTIRQICMSSVPALHADMPIRSLASTADLQDRPRGVRGCVR
jgi:hypothetical protein